MACPTAAASVRIFFIRASGANGVPFSMPIEASSPSVSGSIASAGSSWMTSFTSSKNEASIAWIVLKAFPDTLTKFVAGGFAASASG